MVVERGVSERASERERERAREWRVERTDGRIESRPVAGRSSERMRMRPSPRPNKKGRNNSLATQPGGSQSVRPTRSGERESEIRLEREEERARKRRRRRRERRRKDAWLFRRVEIYIADTS